jgi:rare lipoprotein A
LANNKTGSACANAKLTFNPDHPMGDGHNCAGGQEILASHYASGRRTATGERFDANGNTAAARTWPLGTTLTVTNPQNGRSLTVRVNDTGPWGIAYRMGARLDLARGAAQRLGMRGAQYVCVA